MKPCKVLLPPIQLCDRQASKENEIINLSDADADLLASQGVVEIQAIAPIAPIAPTPTPPISGKKGKGAANADSSTVPHQI